MKQVVIRDVDRLSCMGELGKAIAVLAKNGAFRGKTYPLIYQFEKGLPGESVMHTPDEVIGTVSNVALTVDGLLGDVEIVAPMRNAKNFDGETIDNIVVSVRPDQPEDKKYGLTHFVVYNIDNKNLKKQQKAAGQNVEKMYNAPKEVLDADMNNGDILAKNIASWEQTKEQTIKGYDYRSGQQILTLQKSSDAKEEGK